jgi:hypothetical protein
MTRRAVVALVVSTSLFGARGAAAHDGDAVARFRKARAEVVERLEAFATWCGSNNCPGDRDRAYETVLEIEPDDASARKALHYERGKDGKWRRSGQGSSSQTDPARAADVADRRDAAVRELRDAALSLLFEADVPFDVRERAVDDLLVVDPSSPEGRSANHEKNVDGKWLLEETVVARRRRGELTKAVADARRAASQPTKSAPSAEETAIVPNCGPAFRNAAVRVVGGPGTGEAEEVARVIEALGRVYADALGDPAPKYAAYRVWLFASHDDGLAAMDRDPRFTQEERTFNRIGGSGWCSKAFECFVWQETPEDRVEVSMRQTLGAHMRATYGVDAKNGWAFEGVGQWFSDVVVGRHRCFFVRPTDYSRQADPALIELRRRLMLPESDWLAEARDLERSPRWPDMRVLLGRDVNALTLEDSLAAYALARFFIEGRPPHETSDVMRCVAKGGNPDAWIGPRLGMTLEHLDRRLRRWVRESK